MNTNAFPNFRNTQQQPIKIQKECVDYSFGFCLLGPNCQNLHIKKSESQRPKKVPEWYTQKIQDYFQNDAMTRNELLLKVVQSAVQCYDQQSMIFSQGATQFSMSDVLSERSDPQHMNNIQSIIDTTRPILRGRTRFFVVKSFNYESLEIAKEHQVWSTSSGPTKKLENAFKNADHVILIFSVNESKGFQGFALMESEPNPDYKPDYFINDNQAAISYSDNFKIRWIVSCEYPFMKLAHLPPNPMNENYPIKQSKNGQELPFRLGNYICHLLYNFTHQSKKIHCPLETLFHRSNLKRKTHYQHHQNQQFNKEQNQQQQTHIKENHNGNRQHHAL